MVLLEFPANLCQTTSGDCGFIAAIWTLAFNSTGCQANPISDGPTRYDLTALETFGATFVPPILLDWVGDVWKKLDFSAGDTIIIRSDDGKHVAKAEANYSSCLLNFITQHESDEGESDFQHQTGPLVSDKNIARLYITMNEPCFV